MDQKKVGLGYLRTCMDRRFVEKTRKAFERATGLKPRAYWHESYPGGSALPTNETGENYAYNQGARIFGWQAHIDHCGGQPGVSDEEIIHRLDSMIAEKKAKFPDARHFRILVSAKGLDIREV